MNLKHMEIIHCNYVSNYTTNWQIWGNTKNTKHYNSAGTWNESDVTQTRTPQAYSPVTTPVKLFGSSKPSSVLDPSDPRSKIPDHFDDSDANAFRSQFSELLQPSGPRSNIPDHFTLITQRLEPSDLSSKTCKKPATGICSKLTLRNATPMRWVKCTNL